MGSRPMAVAPDRRQPEESEKEVVRMKTIVYCVDDSPVLAQQSA